MNLPRRVVVAVAVLVAAVVPYFVFAVYLPRFVTRHGALDRAKCRRSELPVVPPAGAVTVLVVDGLGFDYARELPELAWLRSAGAMRPLAVEYPTYTTPSLLSLATGVGPRLSGVRLNAKVAPVTAGLDNLRACADAVGRPIDFFDGGWGPFGEIMFADDSVLWRGRRASEAAAAVSRSAEPGLRFVYFGDVDHEGHEHGRASPEYRAAAVRSSHWLERFYRLRGPRDRLVVVSDHGHLASGGHGGVEPDVSSALFATLGFRVKAGAELTGRPFHDAASTVAVLAGIPTPGCNVGTPMLDMFALDEAARTNLAAATEDQRAAVLIHLPAEGDPQRFWRLAIFGLGVAALGAATRRHMPAKGAWLVGLALIVGFIAFLAARGYRLTFSKMPQQDDFMRDASIGATLGVALAVSLARRVANAEGAVLASVALPMLAMIAWVGFDAAVVPPPYVGLAVILWSPLCVAGPLLAMGLAFFGRTSLRSGDS